jgi:glutamate-5-semialdehyde dehydrogenase
MDLEEIGRNAKRAARALALASVDRKNAALEAIAAALGDHRDAILDANAQDVAEARAAGMSPALLDRLLLTPERLAGIAGDTRAVVGLDDPVGERFDQTTLPNGLRVHKRRTPLGVVGAIYESRPNVTVDIAALCLKAGSAVILRGGKETRRSSEVLAEVIRLAIGEAGLPADAVVALTDPDRELLRGLLRLDRYVDMIIPRGGAGLHRFCLENATVPVITGGVGIVHIYLDAAADAAKALPIIFNAKVQRPSVCNALDTLLVHRARARELLPLVADDLGRAGVELRCDGEALAILAPDAAARGWKVVPAGPDDFGTEFMALICALRVVGGMDEALDHIAAYGTHSEAIVTEDAEAAARFLDAVDSAYVAWNASTRFNDGGQLGLGAEIAVSTQKLHARGPMGLRELTSYKWVVEGDGQVRA